MSSRSLLATRLPIMLHFLKETAVFTPKAFDLAIRPFKLHTGVGQLGLSFATDLDGRFKVLDVIRSYTR